MITPRFCFIHWIFVGYFWRLIKRYQNSLVWTRGKANQSVHQHVYLFWWLSIWCIIISIYIYISSIFKFRKVIGMFCMVPLRFCIWWKLQQPYCDCRAVVTLQPKSPDPTISPRRQARERRFRRCYVFDLVNISMLYHLLFIFTIWYAWKMW